MGGKGCQGRREKEETGGHGKEGEMGRANKWGNRVGIQKRRIEDMEEQGEDKTPL